MPKFLVSLVLLVIYNTIWGQEVVLPSDFRQHSLTQFNASLFNPTYALDWNTPNSLSVWTRWQWQSIDGDPTSIFANYTHQLNSASVASAGFLQHNTGVFLYTGANLTFAQTFELDEGVSLMAGLNIFAFQQTVADEQFVQGDVVDPIALEDFEGFKVQFSPGLRLLVNQFSAGLAFENAIGFNVSGNNRESMESFQSLIGTLSNDFPVMLSESLGDSYVRPVLYLKSVPNGDTQFGLNGLFSTSKFWVQGGYNSFYGISSGLGVTISNAFSVGGLMEFGTDDLLSEEDPTIEIVASYHFGKTKSKDKVPPEEPEEILPEPKEDEEAKRREEEIVQQRREQEQRELEARRKLQREKDSLAEVQRIKKELELQREKDSIARLQHQKVVVRPNERYEEMESEDGLVPGFYLIANVYGTKRYFDNFMKTLREQGLEPKSFYRSFNKYNYVYLERYNTMEEARKARDSKFFGKYDDKTWIFRVKGN
ncbi:PorP/SprF family type IX secretion system membrane protein [Flagellimonas halotolerans]|uniref:PorP/SprF family type IX secretion system membrane protein n=1 Tax=Flagellimonas halotolerans TaxID=3112164 RepID=A0ABU6IU01_9FLAO|nr:MULTISPECIES: PorP/SprF family type IX secretion system membrane protein [unclassified Allomuricauda]MEC3966543.1 PorP/SprF family type IX secretion system membrane protein [Muricauda sp. SYSU M86414]MEC4266484.1 PorP/SprF family type IX secretion system membrane protein [Muricauda sp. SYSU M84420]